MNTKRIRWELMKQYYKNIIKKESKILDIGCGDMFITKLMKEELEYDMYGVDIIEWENNTGISFDRIEDNKIPFKDNTFDYAIFNCVLHHINFENQKDILKEAKRVSKIIIIFEDKKSINSYLWDMLFGAKEAKPLPFAYRDSKEWCKLINELGLNVEYINVDRPFYYPIKHMIFKCEK